MRKSSITIISLFISILLFIAAAGKAADKLEARLDPTQVSLGETVQLTVKAEGQLRVAPDTSALEKDFYVLGTSSGSSINIINGNMTSSTTWRITLQPKRGGTLTIPALEIDGNYTEPLSLAVSASPSPQEDSGADIFIETELAPEAPYERQQVIYKVRLFHAVNLAEGSITAPEPQNIIVHRLGEERTYETTRNNKRYRVIERDYALFPQQAGNLIIAPPVFEGKVYEKTRRGNPFDSFLDHDPFGMFSNSTRAVRIAGREASLTVRPRPEGLKGPTWLPADFVSLSEAWHPEQNTVKTGEAVTRTITIIAGGQDGAALPELSFDNMDGLNIYQDKAKVETDRQNDGIMGTRQQRTAFIPVRPGTFTLPEVTLQWWDIKEERMRAASLPSRTITVLPGDNRFSSPVQTEKLPQEPENPALPTERAEKVPLAQAPPVVSGRHFPWQFVALAFAAAWFCTLLLWWRDRKNRKKTLGTSAGLDQSLDPTRGDFRKEVVSACKKGDALHVRSALLKWSALLWPENPPKGLADLIKRIEDQETADALAELDRYLYGSNPGPWDGRKLGSLLRHFPEKSSRESEKKKPLLPSLYK